MKGRFDFDSIIFRALCHSDKQRIVAYDFSTSKKKRSNEQHIFTESFDSFYEYNYIPSPKEYEDVPNSIGDMAREMMRWLGP